MLGVWFNSHMTADPHQLQKITAGGPRGRNVFCDYRPNSFKFYFLSKKNWHASDQEL